MNTIRETIPVDYEQQAAEILTQLRQIAQSIEGFGFTTTRHRRQITSTASVPDAFLQTIAIVCDAEPDLAAACRLTSTEIHRTIAFTQAYLAVADEFALLAKGLRDTIAEHRFEAGHRAIRLYKIAKTFTRAGQNSALVPHLDILKRDLGRSRGRKTVDTPAPIFPEATVTTPEPPAIFATTPIAQKPRAYFSPDSRSPRLQPRNAGVPPAGPLASRRRASGEGRAVTEARVEDRQSCLSDSRERTPQSNTPPNTLPIMRPPNRRRGRAFRGIRGWVTSGSFRGSVGNQS